MNTPSSAHDTVGTVVAAIVLTAYRLDILKHQMTRTAAYIGEIGALVCNSDEIDAAIAMLDQAHLKRLKILGTPK